MYARSLLIGRIGKNKVILTTYIGQGCFSEARREGYYVLWNFPLRFEEDARIYEL
jgi:hypothetical protein